MSATVTLLLCALLLIVSRSRAEPTTVTDTRAPETPSFFKNENYWGSSFDATSFKIMGVGVLTSLAVSGQDNWARDTGGHHSVMEERVEAIGDILGSGVPGVLVGLAQWKWDPENGESHLKSLAATAGWTYALKTAVSRKRPGSSRNYQSWPSGHTSTISTSAASLWYSYGWKVGLPVTALAVFTAASRIASDAHFLSDVVGGAAVGLWMGRAYHQQSKTSLANSEPLAAIEPSLLIIPSFGNETLFLSVLYDF